MSHEAESELQKAIAEHRFVTMHEQAVPDSVKIRWVLGDAGAAEIMPLIKKYAAQLRIDQVNKEITEKGLEQLNKVPGTFSYKVEQERKKNDSSPYIVFQDMGLSESGKTRVWYVVNLRNEDDVPGIIKWNGGWRKYVYYSDAAYYDWQCLRQIARFIENATHAQKTGGPDMKICLNCGTLLTPVNDAIAGKVTGHLWHCDNCMDPNVDLSIG